MTPEPVCDAAAVSVVVTIGLVCASEYAGTDRTTRLVPPTTVVMTTDLAVEATHVATGDWGTVAGAMLIGTLRTDCPATWKMFKRYVVAVVVVVAVDVDVKRSRLHSFYSPKHSWLF